MQIRSLGGVSWDDLAPVFNEAFSDYAVPMVVTPGSLASMQRRRGSDVELSWQNSLASLRRAHDPYAVVGDARGAAVDGADWPAIRPPRHSLTIN